MEDHNNCSICFDTFTLPKMLHCGHTFCFQCLKDYTDERSSGQGLFCPLCRTKWKIPREGLGYLPTNYFVDITKSQSKEMSCVCCHKLHEILNLCKICGSYFCKKCFGKHFHSKNLDVQDDSEEESEEFRLPGNACFKGVKTMHDLTVKSHFVVETPSEIHSIYSIKIARCGGIYVVPAGVPFIFKFNSTGNVADKIKTPYQCGSVIEFSEDLNLLAAFFFDKLILKYEKDCWCNFTACSDFYPADILELPDGSILACGTDQLGSKSDVFVKRTGHLQLYSQQGEPLIKLDERMKMTEQLVFPHNLSYNKKNSTIAIADQDTNSVLILKKDWSSYKIFKSPSTATISLPFIGIEHRLTFHVSGMCANDNGGFIAATPEGVLLFIDCSGNLSGVGMTSTEDRFGRLFPHVALDSEGTIWCSDSLYGTIKTFKIVRYCNRLAVNIYDSCEGLDRVTGDREKGRRGRDN